MININEYQDKSFFNPYLKSVAFEIRYPSSITIMKNIEKFQEKIKENFPHYKVLFPLKLSVPVEKDAYFPLLTHLFLNRSESEEIRIQHNSIAFITKNYQKFSHFNTNVTNTIDKFTSSYNAGKCFRLGLRYTNEYFIENEDIIEVKREIKNNFVSFISKEIETNYNIIGNQLILAIKEGDIDITLKSIVKHLKDEKKYLFVLDFDAYILEDVKIENYKEILKELRKIQKKYFLSFIKMEFLEKMEFYKENE